MLYRGNLERNL